MGHRFLTVILAGPVITTLAACANPASSVKGDAATFRERFPTHVQTLNVGGQSIQYAWSGDSKNRALLFVHGSPGSWEGWAHFLLDPKLQKKFQIIAVDRPGYGGSGKGNTERSVLKQAVAINEVLKLNESGLPAILVGHSYGGPVVARMAMTYPKQVAGVIFVASSVAPDLEKTKWYQYPGDWWIIRDLIPSPLKVCNQEIFALKSELTSMMPAWKAFSAKVVTIQGEDDDLVPLGNQDFLLSVLDPKLVVRIDRVKGLNHFIPWRRPDLIFNGIAEVDEAIERETNHALE